MKKSLVAAAIVSACLAFPAWAGADVLWDQNDSPATNGATSQVGTESGGGGIDVQAADDFTVPAGQQWTIQSVGVTGQYEIGSGPVQGLDVFIYSDGGGVPGALLFSQLAPGETTSDPSFLVGVFGAPPLAPGHYWLSFRVELNDYPLETWDWKNRTAVSGSPAMYRDRTGTQFPDCPTWMPRTSNVCADDANHPDQMFILRGVSGAVTTAPGPGTTAPGPGTTAPGPGTTAPAAKKKKKKKCKKHKKHKNRSASSAKKKKCKKKRKR